MGMVMDLQAVLNTQVYFGGSPYDKDGEDTYVLPGWSENAAITRLQFLRDEGDAKFTLLEFYSRDAESGATELYGTVLVGVSETINLNEPITVFGSKKNRLHVRIIAKDGEEQNHCKLVVRGKRVEDAAGFTESVL